jgi:hypothetical protein
MDEITTVLKRERWLVGILLFRLTELDHLEAAGETRFLPWARAEVDDAVARVREVELIRATLMADSIPARRGEFVEHCDALWELMLEVRMLAGADVSLPTLDAFLSQLVP